MTGIPQRPQLLLVSVLCSCAFAIHGAALPEPEAVTNVSRFGLHPSWSPDSQSIAFSDTNSSGIWIYSKGTAETRNIHTMGSFPAWSPKGDQIAFRKSGHLWLIHPDGTEAKDTGVTVGDDLRWSPDCKFLVAHGDIYGPHDLFILIETATWTVTELPFAKTGPRHKVGDCAWTPEGNLIITPPVGETGDWQSNEIREYSPKGALVRRIILHGFEAKPFDANISSDGTLIVFHRGSRGIWVASRDGSNVRHIMAEGAGPVWSPDGRSIAYDDSNSTWNIRNGIFVLTLKPRLRL